MPAKNRFYLITALVIILILATSISLAVYFHQLPRLVPQHETILLGHTNFSPNSQAAIRVVVRDSKDASPLPDSTISVRLRPAKGGKGQTLFTGTTDRSGTVNVSFKVPEVYSPEQMLIVETRSRYGQDTVEKLVKVERNVRILLTTDKPIYQPGQTVHIRALSLNNYDLTPFANSDLEVTIVDGKSNKVFRKTVKTSSYGIASLDFNLASQVNTGVYKITAISGKVTSEKTITVENYVLPKFKVILKAEKPYYLPGEKVRGTVQSDYFFGKPVSNAVVLLEGFTFDVQRTNTFRLETKTDLQGKASFEFDLPRYIAGSILDGGAGRFYLQASITDETNHLEMGSLSLPVSQNRLMIQAVLESSVLKPGIDNILYILTSYPDGSPAESSLTISYSNPNTNLNTKSGYYGLAEVKINMQSLGHPITIHAMDKFGNQVTRQIHFNGDYSGDAVLLRPEKPVYRVGETMNLSLFTQNPTGTVYLDIIRQGQTLNTRSADMINGKSEISVDLTPDMFGTLELHAYKLLPNAAITRDTRLVVVDAANDLSLNLQPEQDTYKPGDKAMVNVQVTGKDGKGAQAALGLAVVDEAVFALAEQDPGFARLYFLLEKELLQPKYDLHGLTIPQLSAPPASINAELFYAAQGAARASLASASSKAGSFSLQANSHWEAVRLSTDLRKNALSHLSTAMVILFCGCVTAMLGTGIASLFQRKVLGRGLWLSVILVTIGILSFYILAPSQSNSFTFNPLERLEIIFDTFDQSPLIFFLIFGGLSLVSMIGFIILIIHAWVNDESSLAISLMILLILPVILSIMIFGWTASNTSPSDWIVYILLGVYWLIPLSFLLRANGYALTHKPLAAIGAYFTTAGLPFLMTIPLIFFTLPMFNHLVNFSSTTVNDGMVQEMRPPMMMPVPTAAAGVREPSAKSAENAVPGAAPAQAEPPRLRQYFPETMFWLPEIVTDSTGRLKVDIPIADSITTWRMTALASSQDGRLGSVSAPLKVFQDFFIDLDLPLSLTVGDEISVPVGVFNYMSQSQKVRLEANKQPWFEWLDTPAKEIMIEANDISVVYFRIRVTQFGVQPFRVTATGTRLSDAIQKEVRVFPNGKQITFTESNQLNPSSPIKLPVRIPADAIPGTQSLIVKIYPGIFSQVVEGLDSILRMPYGCFEQTSSTTYPNVLVLDYLKTTRQTSPETQMKAEQYINLGYQRLTTFEVKSSGGFSLFGNPPADRMLTAYGLQQFSDMSRVSHVDPALIKRAAEWLLAQQSANGSWENDQGLVHESTWKNLKNDRLPVTAYIVWSLIEAGYAKDPRTIKGLDYLREFQAQAEDAYVLGLVTNALVAADLETTGKISLNTEAVLNRLAAKAIRQGEDVSWESSVATFMGSKGQTNSIETTALASYSFLRANRHTDLANAALVYLVRQKDHFGTWHSTQATVLALKALLQSVKGVGEKNDATVQLSLNGSQQKMIRVTPQNYDVVQFVSYDDLRLGEENQVELTVNGKSALMYQVSGSYYLPWDKITKYPDLSSGKEAVTIEVKYDRKELSVNDTIIVKVSVTMNQPGKAEWALIDLGVPPGFAVLTEDLNLLVNRFKGVPRDYPNPTIQRYELTGRQILIYAGNLTQGKPLQFSYRLRALYPLVAQSPASSAYDYYNPAINGESTPQLLKVR